MFEVASQEMDRNGRMQKQVLHLFCLNAPKKREDDPSMIRNDI